MISVKKAEQEHLPRITEIENASFSLPWSPGQLEETLDRTYVAGIQGEVAGFICVGTALNEAHILHMAVHPEMRRKGVGRELVKKIIELPAELFYLEVRESNAPARLLYEGMGFRVISERRGYYSDNNETALVMEHRKNV